jgi:hypothetical protein
MVLWGIDLRLWRWYESAESPALQMSASRLARLAILLIGTLGIAAPI